MRGPDYDRLCMAVEDIEQAAERVRIHCSSLRAAVRAHGESRYEEPGLLLSQLQDLSSSVSGSESYAVKITHRVVK